jgi:uncharacterized protein YsxB (DUF464 family)
MITAVVTRDRTALLRSLAVAGHAEHGPPGADIVCAAVSVLTRTAAAVLSGKAAITADILTPARGELYLDVQCRREGEPYLCAVQDFLLEGLSSVAAEYPECLRLVFEECA